MDCRLKAELRVNDALREKVKAAGSPTSGFLPSEFGGPRQTRQSRDNQSLAAPAAQSEKGWGAAAQQRDCIG
jgi:hypothetical protein